ncbi:MAG: peptidase MA family metallohydrolase [Candidatus Poribacteria bacterium]|nr:peptidase MA family metallohydrolase [Candidatus Poribacteria bacterium]
MIKSFLLCLCALFLISPLGTHADTRESWDLIESENYLVYYRGNVKSAQRVLDIAEDFHPKMRRLMGDIHLGKIEIWVCEAPSEFQAAVHAPIQDWAIGCAFPLSRRIVIQNPRVIVQRDFQLSQVIRHEIVHIVFGQRTQKAIGKIPRWFVEGIAIYFSGEWAPRRNDTLMKHIFSKSVIPLADLSQRFPKSENLAQLAYAESQNAVTWLAETHGVEKLWEIIDRLASGIDLDSAFRDSIGLSLSAFDAKWRKSLSQRYHWAAMLSSSHLFWGSLALFFLLVYLRYWRYKRRRLRELERESEEVDAFFIER